MKCYTISRYGHPVRDIIGKESDLLKWIRENVPPQSDRIAIRGAEVSKYVLYDDAEAAGIKITSKKI